MLIPTPPPILFRLALAGLVVEPLPDTVTETGLLPYLSRLGRSLLCHCLSVRVSVLVLVISPRLAQSSFGIAEFVPIGGVDGGDLALSTIDLGKIKKSGPHAGTLCLCIYTNLLYFLSFVGLHITPTQPLTHGCYDMLSAAFL